MITLIPVVKRCPSWSFGLALLLVVTLAIGCSKDSAAEAQQKAATADAGPPAPVSQPPPGVLAPKATASAPVNIPANADTEATLQQLSLELRKYVMRTRSVPKNFDEFAANARIQVPPPPAGKKYAIENQAVVLVKH